MMSKQNEKSTIITPLSCTLSQGAGFSRLPKNNKFVNRNQEKQAAVISLCDKYNAQLADNVPVSSVRNYESTKGKDNHFTLILDWLQCRYSIGERVFNFNENNLFTLYKGEYIMDADGVFEWVDNAYSVKFELLPKSTKFCKKVANIYVTNGGGTDYLGYCCFEPFDGSILPKDFFQLKIDNALLYTPYCASLIDTFVAVTGFQFVGFSRVDIALDTPSDYFRNVCYFDKFHPSTEILRVGRFEVYYSDVVGAEKIQLGKSNCPKYMVIYNKTKELANGKKPYIVDFHKQNFGSAAGDIWRYELRLMNDFFAKLTKNKAALLDTRNRALSDLGDLTPQKLLDPSTLRTIYQFGSSVFTQFRKNTDSNITRCERLKFFDFGRVFTNLVYLDKQAPNSLFMAKRVLKMLFKEVVYSGVLDLQLKKQHLKNAYKILSPYCLNDWLSERVPKWAVDWEKDVYLNGLSFSIEPLELLGYLC